MTDSTASPLWSVAGFPDQVSNPADFNVAVNINNTTHSVSLVWPSVVGALYYSVYYGMEDTRLVLFQTDITGNSYTFPSGAIGLNTLYNVQVVAFQSPRKSVGSPVYQFTVPYAL